MEAIQAAVLSLAEKCPAAADIAIRGTPDRGDGVFAGGDIEEGAFVTAYAGLILDPPGRGNKGYKVLLTDGPHKSVDFDGFIVRHMLDTGVEVPKSLLGALVMLM